MVGKRTHAGVTVSTNHIIIS